MGASCGKLSEICWRRRNLPRSKPIDRHAVTKATIKTVPPAIRLVVYGNATGVRTANGNLGEGESPRNHGRSKASGSSIVDANLAIIIVTPTKRHSRRRHAACVIPSSSDLTVGGRRRYRRGNQLVFLAVVAELALIIMPPAIHLPLRRNAAGVTVSGRNSDKMQITGDRRWRRFALGRPIAERVNTF